MRKSALPSPSVSPSIHVRVASRTKRNSPASPPNFARPMLRAGGHLVDEELPTDGVAGSVVDLRADAGLAAVVVDRRRRAGGTGLEGDDEAAVVEGGDRRHRLVAERRRVNLQHVADDLSVRRDDAGVDAVGTAVDLYPRDDGISVGEHRDERTLRVRPGVGVDENLIADGVAVRVEELRADAVSLFSVPCQTTRMLPFGRTVLVDDKSLLPVVKVASVLITSSSMSAGRAGMRPPLARGGDDAPVGRAPRLPRRHRPPGPPERGRRSRLFGI